MDTQNIRPGYIFKFPGNDPDVSYLIVPLRILDGMWECTEYTFSGRTLISAQTTLIDLWEFQYAEFKTSLQTML